MNNPFRLVTKQDLKDFYNKIKPYLGYEEMEDSDMDDVVTPLPSVGERYHKYSTEEQVVGEWVNGKPIYEKTVAVRSGNCVTEGVMVQTSFPFTTEGIDWASVFSTNYQAPFITNLQVATVSSSSSYFLMGIRMVASVSTKSIVIQCTIPAFANTDFYVTVRYTKTTD